MIVICDILLFWTMLSLNLTVQMHSSQKTKTPCCYITVQHDMILDTMMLWLTQNINQSLKLQMAPHDMPSLPSYGMLVVNIPEKIDSTITALQCTLFLTSFDFLIMSQFMLISNPFALWYDFWASGSQQGKHIGCQAGRVFATGTCTLSKSLLLVPWPHVLPGHHQSYTE